MAYEDVKAELYGREREKVANNTYLELGTYPNKNDGDFVNMYLHNNIVATFNKDHIRLFSSGWYTDTTKNRLNMALGMARVRPYFRVYQRNWIWHIGWYSLARGHNPTDPVFFDGIKLNYQGDIIP